ncbi:MAG: S-layer homology domain-containing protein [Oscillospiraceae bacterium]|nr:S-layer homology domain-containing protein [Oscillospiraceae bacterium]
MKKRIAALMLILVIFIQTLSPSVAAACVTMHTATQQEITAAILALQEEYPDGMTWTNTSQPSSYVWVFPGSLVSMSGCAALAAILQDSVFGTIKEAPVFWQRITTDYETRGMQQSPAPYSWDTLWPGDILIFHGHTVLVLEKYDDRITIVEGNNGGKIRWGRTISRDGVETAKYVWTRYDKSEPLMPYTDLPESGHWSYAAVTWALLTDVAAPISATLFGPKEQCTRADVISFLWAASGRPEPELEELPFTDVPADAAYRTAVLWAMEKGITSGTSATTFSPDTLCTRAHALTFMWRLVGSPTEETDNIGFDDVPCSKYYYESVTWAAVNNITSGTSATAFSPDRTISRAEALTFLYLIKGPQV